MQKKNPEVDQSSINSKKIARSILNVADFKLIVQKIKIGNKETKKSEIVTLLNMEGMITHYRHKTTKRTVISDCLSFEFVHARITAEKLAGVNYDVVFAPKGYFERDEKKFDVFLCREHIFLEADLKCLTSLNPDTISKRIKAGSKQSSRLVLDIQSNIKRNDLIEGMKSGCERNNAVREILLFFNSRFYSLPKNQILSKKIYDTIK